MPSHAPTSCDRPELVDGVARNEVDRVTVETNLSVAHTLSPQLVEFGFIHPLATLGRCGEGKVIWWVAT